MKCRRAFDADLAAVLRGECDDADFLAHYPRCADCATEVGVWRELESMLRAGGSGDAAHPEPEVLLAFADAAPTLSDVVRLAIERHLAACRVCADEVRALAGFEAARTVAARSAAAAPASPALAAPEVAPARGSLARVVRHPAFAVAVVAVLLVPLLRDKLPSLTTPARVLDARRDEVPSARQPAASTEPSILLAERDAPRERSVDRVAAEAPRPSTRAVAPPAAPPPPPAQAAAAPPAAAPVPPAAVPRAEEGVAKRAVAEARRPGTAMGELAGGARARAADADAEKATALLADAVPGAAAAPPARPEADRPAEPAQMLEELQRRHTVPREIPRAFLPRILQVTDGTSFGAAGSERGAQLRVIPPSDLPAGPLDVVVRSRAGQPDVHAHVADHAEAIEVDIPRNWLVPGAYSVVLQPVDAAGNPNARPTVIGFAIRAPEADR